MKKLIFLSLFLVSLTLTSQEKATLDYYLPSNTNYNKNIPTPESIIGHEVGEWHITHDKLVYYMQALAASSDRISIENRGETFEGRPLLLLTITAPKNHGKIEQIQKDHLSITKETGATQDVSNLPVVVYQGFSIHGNEPSGSNAALAYAY
ncbi:MAG: M14 family zinc carboxypeptidase, partial [Cellulophaga baltica]